MIIANGVLMVVELTGGGYVNGVPQAENRVLGEPMICNISGSRQHDNTIDDSSYTSATYEVLIDDTSFFAQEVVLYNNRQSRLGTFRVQDIQYLDCVDAIKLICVRYAD